MRKPPELLVTLAPLVVFVLVLAGVGIAFALPDGKQAAGASAAPSSQATGSPTTPLGELPTDDLEGVSGLRNKVGKQLRALPAFSFRIASFNVLGHSHTVRGGDQTTYTGSSARMAWTLPQIEAAAADVVGFQELQTPQYAAFRQAAPGWEGWPGTAVGRHDVDNTLVWNTATFRAVDKRTIAIPYFWGHTREMPYVLLEHLSSKQRIWVANFHNPAHKYGASHAQHRQEALRREIRLANDLTKTGYPVFFTGDMNDRIAYCRAVTSGSDLRWAGGSCTGRRAPVDWILGSSRVAFTDYRIAERGIVGRISDHPLISATATVPARAR